MSYQSGFCITRHHATCKGSLSYYDKTWFCECECHSGTQPELTPALNETKLELIPADQQQRSEMSKSQSKTNEVIFEAASRAIKAGHQVADIKGLAKLAAEIKGATYANAIRNYQAKIRELAAGDAWLMGATGTITLKLTTLSDGEPGVELTLATAPAAIAVE